jgi:predicted Zn-dependent protease
MSQPDSDTIKQAQELIRSKELSKAQRLLVEYIKKNPHSEQAWLVLSSAVDDRANRSSACSACCASIRPTPMRNHA